MGFGKQNGTAYAALAMDQMATSVIKVELVVGVLRRVVGAIKRTFE
jgi:hypothetical protein